LTPLGVGFEVWHGGGRIQRGGREASAWWRDSYALCQESWFSDNISLSLGNEKHTLFWSDVWLWRISFRVRFSRLYDLSMFKELSIFDMCQLGWGEEGGSLELEAEVVCMGGGDVGGYVIIASQCYFAGRQG